jgi:hypothetical protein
MLCAMLLGGAAQVDPRNSLGWLSDLTVDVANVDAGAAALGITKEAVQAQVERALRKHQIPVFGAGQRPAHDGPGVSGIVSVVVITLVNSQGTVAVRYDMNVLQALDAYGDEVVVATTWASGSLFTSSRSASNGLLREGMARLLDGFCDQYLEARAAYLEKQPAKGQARLPEIPGAEDHLY